MGTKAKSRILALLVAAVMIMTSAVGVFAVESSQMGDTKTIKKTVVSVSKGTITVTATGEFKSSKGKIKGNTITGLKEGQKVTITSLEDGKKVYRWIKTVKIKKAKKGKVTWGKVKGATSYLVRIQSKSGKVTWKTVKGTSLKVKKGSKVRIRPLYKKGGKTYSGMLCAAKTVK